MNKIYVINVKYYIQADDIDELEDVLKSTGISDSEYYGGYDIEDIEEDEEEEDGE